MVDTIERGELAAMLRSGANEARANHEELSRLDSATGDGDHGTSMKRAMDAVNKAIDDSGASGDPGDADASGDLKSLLHDIGWAVMSTDSGSTGPLLGSFFMGMSEAVEGKETLNASDVAAMFASGQAGIQKQSKAQVGDKTMMDALIPAVEALGAAGTDDIGQMLRQGAEAAAKGAAATTDMLAKFGRARNLGDRVLGHVDAGATSMSYLFRGFAKAF